ADAIRRSLGQPRPLQRFAVDDFAVVEGGIEVADVDDEIVLLKASVAEAAFGDAAEQLHLPALEDREGHVGARAGILALAASTAGLAVAGTGTATDAFLLPELVNAVVNR